MDTIYAQESWAATPLSFGASLRVDLGAGDDTLVFGPDNLTGQPLETHGLVRLEGGSGTDTLDHLNHHNDYLGGAPTLLNFEQEQ